MSKDLTRKEFLTNTSKYAVGAVAGVVGLNALAGGKILANPNDTTWPWPYQPLDDTKINSICPDLKHPDEWSVINMVLQVM